MGTITSAHQSVAFASLMFYQCWQLEGTLLLHWVWDNSNRNRYTTPQVSSQCLEQYHAHTVASQYWFWLSEWKQLFIPITQYYSMEFRIRVFYFTTRSSKAGVFLWDRITAWNEKTVWQGSSSVTGKGHSFLFTLMLHLQFLITSNLKILLCLLSESRIISCIHISINLQGCFRCLCVFRK